VKSLIRGIESAELAGSSNGVRASGPRKTLRIPSGGLIPGVEPAFPGLLHYAR